MERLEEWHIYWIGRDRSAAAAVLLRRPAMSGELWKLPRAACGGLVGDLWLVRLICYVDLVLSTPCGSCVEHYSRAGRLGL